MNFAIETKLSCPCSTSCSLGCHIVHLLGKCMRHIAEIREMETLSGFSGSHRSLLKSTETSPAETLFGLILKTKLPQARTMDK